MFSHFLINSLIASFWLAVLFSILGIFIMIKRMSFFSDGIAHASILGLAISFLLGSNPLIFALLTAILFSFLIYFLEKKTKIHTDALIGLIFVSALSLGLILMSQKAGYQPELLNFLIGNVLSLNQFDVYLTIIFSLIILSIIILKFRELFLTSFDPVEARLRKINIAFYEILFYLLLAISVILGIKLVGVVLVTAFLILPPITSSLVASSFRNFIFFSIFFSFINVTFGFSLSYLKNLPLGASIVICSSLIFFLIFILKSILRNELV